MGFIIRNSKKNIKKAIENVIESYLIKQDSISGEEILVQEMVQNVAMSGVVFTYDLNTGAPYYVFNYDDISGKTDSVTSGKGEYSNRTLYVFRDSITELRSERFKTIINAILELEKKLDNQFLDIEFALDKHLKPYLLQVRTITTKVNWNKNLSSEISSELDGIKKFVNNRFCKSDGVFGERTVFGQMPDWNPAEMLGRSPRLLSYSLYAHLITDNAWRIAREICGYHIPKGQPLMVSLAGQPFIDTRLSFNSFLPKSLDPEIAEKVLNYWIEKLIHSPNLHDKVEFDVAITAYSFDIDEKLKEYYFLSYKEKEKFKNSFYNLTVPLIKGIGPGSIEKALSKISRLNFINNEKKNTQITNIFSLIEDCINLGTIPFAILARHGFIAKLILSSLVNKNIIDQEDLDLFQSSINTVASDLLIDISKLKNKNLDLNQFMNRYGHLRPGTYDILSKRYDQFQELDLAKNDNKYNEKRKYKFNLSAAKKIKINQIIEENRIENFDVNNLLQYCEKAIKGREYAKFVFTKTLSRLIENIANFGENNGLSREDMSHIPISYLIKHLSYSSSKNLYEELKNISKINSYKHKISSAIRLPQILHDLPGIYIIPFQVSHPNFITHKKIEAYKIFIGTKDSVKDLDNKVVLIENADPGFDWIFSKNIKGLITKYGGVNSHMAIRCAEFGIPAAIGCGEQRFESLIKKDKIILDCASGVISGGH